MSHTLTHLGAPWYEHLIDSVRALGLAAREWQMADQAAAVAEAAVDPDRVSLHEGVVAGVPAADAVGWDARTANRTPHATAVFDLHRLQMDHRWTIRRHYEDAALLYASGAAWAIRQVRDGGTPGRVEFDMDAERRLQPGLCMIPDLGSYAGNRALEVAGTELSRLEVSRDAAEDLAGQTYVSDHEASEMTTASIAAEGLADAAYRFGELAEPALRYVLIGARQRHEAELARARDAR
jgi:hypothetical protein